MSDAGKPGSTDPLAHGRHGPVPERLMRLAQQLQDELNKRDQAVGASLLARPDGGE